MFHRSRQSSREAMFYDTFLEPMPHQSGASCLSVPYVISGLGRFPHGISFLRPRLVSVVLLGAPSGPASQSSRLENRVPHVAVEHVFSARYHRLALVSGRGIASPTSLPLTAARTGSWISAVSLPLVWTPLRLSVDRDARELLALAPFDKIGVRIGPVLRVTPGKPGLPLFFWIPRPHVALGMVTILLLIKIMPLWSPGVATPA